MKLIVLKILVFYLVILEVYFTVVRFKYPFLYKKHMFIARQFFCNFEPSFTLKGAFLISFTYIYRIMLYLTVFLPMRIFVHNGLPIFYHYVGWFLNFFFLIAWGYGLVPVSASIYFFFFYAFTFIHLYVYVKPFRDWVIYRCDLKTDFKYVIWFSFGNPLKDVWKKISPVVVPAVGLFGWWEAEIYQADIKF